MNNEDSQLREALQGSPVTPPPFEQTLESAGRRLRRRTAVRRVGGAAVACGFAFLAFTWQTGPVSSAPQFALQEALMTTTRWNAPSDALLASASGRGAVDLRVPSDTLLPRHRINLYSEMPGISVSTETEEGPLL